MADTDTRVQQLLFKFTSDLSGIIKIKSALGAVKSATEDLNDAQDSGWRERLAAIRKQSDAQYELATSVEAVTKAQEKFNKSVADFDVEKLRQDTQAAIDAANSASSGGANVSGAIGAIGGRGGGLMSVARAASAVGLGSAAEPIRAVADIAEVTKKLPEMSAALAEAGVSLTAVGAAAALAAPLAILAALAIQNINKAIEDGTRIYHGAIAAQKAYYDAVFTLGTKEAEAQKTALQAQQASLEAQVAENTAARDRLSQQAENSPFAGLDVLPALNEANATLEKNKQDLDDVNQHLGRLSTGLQNGVFATNDAIEAEKALEDARTQAVLAQTSAAQSGATQIAGLLNFKPGGAQNSLDQANDLLQGYKNQVDGLNAGLQILYNAQTHSAEQNTQQLLLQRQMGEAVDQYNKILNDVIPTLEAAAQAEFNRLTNLKGRQEIIQHAEQEAAQTQTDYAKALDNVSKATDNYLAGLTKIGGQLEKSIAQAQATLDDARGKAAQAQLAAAEKRDEDLKTASEKAAQDRLKALEEYQNTVKRIERQFQVDATNAVRNRDAVAFTNALEAKKKDLANAKDELNQRRKDITAALKAENDRIKQAYKTQLKTIKDNLDAAQAAYNKAVAVAKATYAQQLSDLQTKLSQEQAIRDAAYQAMITAANNFAATFALATNTINQSAASLPVTSGGTASNSGGLQPSFARGGIAIGRVRINDPGPESALIGRNYAVFTKPTRIFSAQQTQQMMGGGGHTFNFNIHGSDWRKIKREMNASFDEFVRGYQEG